MTDLLKVLYTTTKTNLVSHLLAYHPSKAAHAPQRSGTTLILQCRFRVWLCGLNSAVSALLVLILVLITDRVINRLRQWYSKNEMYNQRSSISVRLGRKSVTAAALCQ